MSHVYRKIFINYLTRYIKSLSSMVVQVGITTGQQVVVIHVSSLVVDLVQ